MLLFSLARIDGTEETKRALHERHRHTSLVFVHGTTGFAFVIVAKYCQEKKNWIVLRTKHQKEGFYDYLYGLPFYLQLACGPQRLCKTEEPAAYEKLLKGPQFGRGPQVVDHCLV